MLKYSPETALIKARAYCNKAERAHQEVRKKLAAWGLAYRDREKIVGILIEENLLNEQRYAEAFVSDKSRFNKWGAVKIEQALKAKGVSERNIRDALKQMDPGEYRKTLHEIADKKLQSYKNIPLWQAKVKTAKYLLARGYESDGIWKVLGE